MNQERQNASVALEYAAIEVLVKRRRLAHLTEVSCSVSMSMVVVSWNVLEEVDNADVDRPFSVSQQGGIDGITGKAMAVVFDGNLAGFWGILLERYVNGISWETVDEGVVRRDDGVVERIVLWALYTRQ